tara:strand:+ start:1179 stop:1526 length:348 start_codon:yes stop_codon:yes gene_type:complete
LALAKLLFDGVDKHITAEALHCEARSAKVPVSLATIYNTLNHFTEAGLLREVVVEAGRSYFDTNVLDHHHFFFEENSTLQDFSGDAVTFHGMPEPPNGTKISRVDVVVRVRKESG